MMVGRRLTLFFLRGFGGPGKSFRPIFTGLLFSAMVNRYLAVCQPTWADSSASFEFTIEPVTEEPKGMYQSIVEHYVGGGDAVLALVIYSLHAHRSSPPVRFFSRRPSQIRPSTRQPVIQPRRRGMSAEHVGPAEWAPNLLEIDVPR